jgi:D-inositol-3-phosphate glycosyltransferase
LGISALDHVVLYVGRFDQLKGLERLLEAMTLLRHRPNIKLVIVGGDGGDDPESKRLRDLCEARKIKSQVHFCGAVDHENVPAFYSAADGLIIPSLYESFSLVALEALACGTPIIATKVGATERLIREGETGTLIQSADPHSLAAGIDDFFSEAAPASRTPQKIRETVLQFSWSHAASALLKEYETGCSC